MEAGTEQVVTGTKLVDETRQSLNKITAVSSEINTLVEAIAPSNGCAIPSLRIRDPNYDKCCGERRKNVQGSSFVSSSFEQLLTVAQALQEDVGQFKVS
jgi:methyl-accepting chemotaxis protein